MNNSNIFYFNTPGGNPLGGQFRHHVVPQGWQKLFSDTGFPGQPYYKNVRTGKKIGPIGPTTKMIEEYGNVIFDRNGFALKDLEDLYGKFENKLLPKLRNSIQYNAITKEDRFDIARFIALQNCRYPEYYENRLNIGKELAIEMVSAVSNSKSSHECNSILISKHKNFSNIFLTDDEFDNLKSSSESDIQDELFDIVYSDFRQKFSLNPFTIIDAIPEIAMCLYKRNWKLWTPKYDQVFYLSDRPVPINMNEIFYVALGPKLMLEIDQSFNFQQCDYFIKAEQAEWDFVNSINKKSEESAWQWICSSKIFN